MLVVDDEPLVRDLETQILRLQGYTVLEAENAAEALRLAREAAAIHLLITDLAMPEIDGLELTRRFREVHPKTPVLMVSGSLPVLGTRSEPDLERFRLPGKAIPVQRTAPQGSHAAGRRRSSPDTKTVVLRLTRRIKPRHRAFCMIC